MTKPPISNAAKKRVKFDEAKFFRHVGEMAKPGLLGFLRSIDTRACVEMATYLIRYLRRWEEEPIVAERKRRAAKKKRALTLTISALKKATVKYTELVALEIPGPGLSGSSSLTSESPSVFVDVLESEIVRLSDLLTKAHKLSKTKRSGVSGNHFWLVLLQEFVSVWTRTELGESRQLKPGEIAVLMMAAKVTLGWRQNMSDTDPELISKAIINFRSNPENRPLVEGAKSYAAQRCHAVQKGPCLSGIKI